MSRFLAAHRRMAPASATFGRFATDAPVAATWDGAFARASHPFIFRKLRYSRHKP
jgi:hypothetical protein